MGEFEGLLTLQEIDSELDALEERERTLSERERYEKLSAEVERAEKVLVSREDQLRAEMAKQKRLEDDIEQLGAKIEREQKHLYEGGASPKELSGIQQEIESLGGRRDELETSLLEQLEVVEPVEKEVVLLAERLAALKGEMEVAKSAYAAVSSEITNARKALKDKRLSILPEVDPKHIEQYDKVRKRHRRAVVLLVGEMCQGCRTDIPAVELKKIKETPGISRCPNCGRMLVK